MPRPCQLKVTPERVLMGSGRASQQPYGLCSQISRNTWLRCVDAKEELLLD